MLAISFIIPTLNRPQELKRLLDSFVAQTVRPDEIIVVNQGEFLPDYQSVKQCQVDFKSLTKARNFGVKQSVGDIVCFLDDDVVLDKEYVKNILNFFTIHPEALGVQGLITNFEEGHVKKVGGNVLVYWLYNLFAKIFLLNNSSSKNRLLLSGRNQYASRVENIINCEWLSGIGNYRRSVFEQFKFDEDLAGYALGEDKLFSFPIFEKYPKSLFLDPSIKCEHHHADFGRPKNKEWVEMKVNYTYYLWNKLFFKKRCLASLAYWWANFGDLLVVLFSLIIAKNNPKFLWWHIVSYWKILWKKAV